MSDQGTEAMQQSESASRLSGTPAANTAPHPASDSVQNAQAGMAATADSGNILDPTVSQQIDTVAGESLANYIGTGGRDSNPQASLRWPQDPGSAIGADPPLRSDTAAGPTKEPTGEVNRPDETDSQGTATM